MQTGTAQTSGPNPYCEIGRNHPRDRHRMKPVSGHPSVWECSRHDLFARIVDKETANGLDRGDSVTRHDGGKGIVVGLGDERQGGILLYYRPDQD